MTAVPAADPGNEFELVVRCARVHRSEADEHRLHRLFQHGIDWPLVIRLAAYHNVRPLLYDTLRRLPSGTIPEEVLQNLGRQVHAIAAFNAFLAGELVRLARLFEARGIASLALKGPVVARMAYGSLGLRPFIDLDILIRPHDFRAVEQLLLEENYTPFPQVARRNELRRQIYLRLSRQYQFAREGIFNLDLHTHIMPPLYHYTIPFDELRQRAAAVPMAGGTVYGLQPEDLLLVLCFHGEKNRWETLKYICDVSELIRSHPGLDWDVTLARARRTRALRILYLGLSLAHHYFEVPLPPEVLTGINRDRAVRQLTGYFTERLPRQLELGIASFGERMRLHMALQNTLLTKARYLFFAFLRRMLDFEA
ncbi:nucleotidyltransferase family protein [Rhodocaloribacter litoris]|uniref:nucleotidyltransferase domain-containing protein n=1 Tax=Rhodocaloribacter litoris TaxID=2558931 RepID=UPI0014229304|nr:nucleotidyltransferase family protein [Rhodocaloribacter litoris]QXD16145.1 nucleotidyltransferase family protein [Rhodocaloribacter litoris]